MNPWVTAAALDALSRGWATVDGLDGWLHEAERSPSIQLRAVAALALFRRGRRGDEGRDSLLRALGTGWNRFNRSLTAEIMDALVAGWADDGEFQDACWAGVGRRGTPKFDISHEDARRMLMRIHREDSRVPRWVQEQVQTRDYFLFGGMGTADALLEPILYEHADVRAVVETWFEEKQSSIRDYRAAQVAALLRSDGAKRAMVGSVAETGELRFWPVWSLLHGWGIDDPEVAAVLEPLPGIPPEERQHIAQHIPAIVGSDDESFQLLTEICGLPEVSRTDFVMEGFAALGNEIDEGRAVSAILPHVTKSVPMFRGEGRLIARFHADPRVREFALARLREPSPPLAAMASVYGSDTEIAPMILHRAAPLPTVFRRYIARRASQRLDDEALRQVLQQCELETDKHATIQATIGLSYAALATLGEAEARTKVLRAQLDATGPHYEDQRAAAFGGLLALGRIDVFAGAKEAPDDEALSIDLVEQFRDYAPVIELAAQRWEELELAMGGSPVSRLSRWHNPAGFWEAFAPYLSRSSLLKTRFLEFCEDESVVLDAPGLVALSRLRPGSSLLFDCCKRILTAQFDAHMWNPLNAARSTVVASKCLAANFSEDSSVVAALVAASERPRARGGALVGLASHSPEHEVVEREYRNLAERRWWPGLLACVQLWLLSAQGSPQQVAIALAQFVTRPASSLWDFPEDALDAFRARLDRDPEFVETLRRLAMDNDEPSVRASTVRLLASMSAGQSRELAEELLDAECRRSGPPRFALDLLTNRIRPARELMREVLRTSNG